MRRCIALVSAAALALAGLTACGQTAATEEPVTLTLWVDQNRMAPLQDAAAKFEAATGNKVELVQKNVDELQADFVTQVGQGQGPDITVGAHDWLGNFIQNGVVNSIDLGAKAADFEAVSLAAFSQDGKLYGVPYAIENIALIRNTTLAPTAPQTWDDAVAAGKAAGTRYPILLQTGTEGDPYTYYPLQTSFGAPVFATNADGSYKTELALGGPNGEAYAKWLQAQGAAGVLDVNINYDIALEAFGNGESPFIIGGPWMLDSLSDVDFDLAIDPIPTPGPNVAAPFSGVQGFYVSAKSANPILANQFLVDYIATTDVQLALYNIGKRTPALTAAAQQVASDPIAAGFAKVAEAAVPMPSIPAMASVWAFWGVTEASIISQQQEPVAAWNKMVTDIEVAIK